MNSDAFPLIWNILCLLEEVAWPSGEHIVGHIIWWCRVQVSLSVATCWIHSQSCHIQIVGLYQLAWTFHYKQTFTSNYYFFFYFTSLSGLKTVIGELPPASSSLAANICRRITGRLTNAIAKVSGLKCILYIVLLLVLNTVLLPWFQSTDVSVQLEALDILGDLLSRFGGQ